MSTKKSGKTLHIYYESCFGNKVHYVAKGYISTLDKERFENWLQGFLDAAPQTRVIRHYRSKP